MTTLRFTSIAFLTLAACSQTNKDHCGNREGDKTCQEQDDGSHPICSSCEASNNGCVAADVEIDASCQAETVADTSTSNGSSPTTDPTTSASQSSTSPSSTDGTQTTDPSTTMTTDDTQTTNPTTTTSSEDTSTTDPTETTTGETSTSSDPVTTDPSESSSTGMENPCGNGVIDPGEPCEGDDLQGETCESQGTASGELACNELCQFDLSGCMPLPTCGDGMLNGDEQCDGNELSVPNCDALNPGLYGNGQLSCNDDCTFDTSNCCIGVGNGCNANTNCCNDCALALCL